MCSTTDGRVNTSGTDLLHNDDNTIVLDSEEEPLEEDDGTVELNQVSEKESDNEQDCSSIANHYEEDDSSMNSSELGGTTISATLQSSSCNEPEIYSESDIQNAISCGDFGRVVQIKTLVNLTITKSFSILFLLSITNFPVVYLATLHGISSMVGSKQPWLGILRVTK